MGETRVLYRWDDVSDEELRALQAQFGNRLEFRTGAPSNKPVGEVISELPVAFEDGPEARLECSMRAPGEKVVACVPLDTDADHDLVESAVLGGRVGTSCGLWVSRTSEQWSEAVTLSIRTTELLERIGGTLAFSFTSLDYPETEYPCRCRCLSEGAHYGFATRFCSPEDLSEFAEALGDLPYEALVVPGRASETLRVGLANRSACNALLKVLKSCRVYSTRLQASIATYRDSDILHVPRHIVDFYRHLGDSMGGLELGFSILASDETD